MRTPHELQKKFGACREKTAPGRTIYKISPVCPSRQSAVAEICTCLPASGGVRQGAETLTSASGGCGPGVFGSDAAHMLRLNLGTVYLTEARYGT